MILPNINKKRITHMYRAYIVILLIISSFITYEFKNSILLLVFILLFIIIVLFGLYYYKKQDIKEVTFDNNRDEIKVDYRNSIIKISIEDICKISSILEFGVFVKNNISIETAIILKAKYPFGRKLYFRHAYDEQFLTSPVVNHEDLSLIKKRIVELFK